jgi:hypothetical protein
MAVGEIGNGAACPMCGKPVRAPMWRVAVSRAVILVLVVVLAAASVIGMGRGRFGEGTRGQHPRTSYATTCKQCGAAMVLTL